MGGIRNRNPGREFSICSMHIKKEPDGQRDLKVNEQVRHGCRQDETWHQVPPDLLPESDTPEGQANQDYLQASPGHKRDGAPPDLYTPYEQHITADVNRRMPPDPRHVHNHAAQFHEHQDSHFSSTTNSVNTGRSGSYCQACGCQSCGRLSASVTGHSTNSVSGRCSASGRQNEANRADLQVPAPVRDPVAREGVCCGTDRRQRNRIAAVLAFVTSIIFAVRLGMAL